MNKSFFIFHSFVPTISSLLCILLSYKIAATATTKGIAIQNETIARLAKSLTNIYEFPHTTNHSYFNYMFSSEQQVKDITKKMCILYMKITVKIIIQKQIQ